MSAHLKVMSAGKTDDLEQRVSEVLARRATPGPHPILTMLAAVSDNRGLTVSELVELSALSKANIHKHIRRLQAAGKVVAGEKIRVPGNHAYVTVWKLSQ